ncbi:MAG: tetratricopeptide repeat protein [Planctomycetota bacterium]|nr:tetratricopeptide repeat protein [Planctomycetota bacterium]
MSRRPAQAVGLALTLVFAPAIWIANPPSCLASPRHGADVMLEPHTASLLVDYFETFLREKDIEAFHRSVTARYTEGTLSRLARSGSLQARRAAVLALGLIGSFQVNETVARGLRDPDPVIRNLSHNALWAIWFRADTAENNATLQEVRDLIGRERYREAQDLAAKLIARSPNFAEAYNQRAIALFSQDKFAESAADCRQALERNPYHVGALAGLGQCFLRLDRRRDALATFRRALKVEPYSTSLKQTVEHLETEGD